MKIEIWKDLPEHEDLYKVSDMGRVKSFHNNQVKILKGNINPGIRSGYNRTKLTKNKIHKAYQTHRLILRAFIGDSDLTVNHKNGIKTDNRLCNLEYMTIQENKIHAAKMGLQNKKLTNCDVTSIRFLSAFHKIKNPKLIKAFKISYSYLVAIKSGARSQYVGQIQ